MMKSHEMHPYIRLKFSKMSAGKQSLWPVILLHLSVDFEPMRLTRIYHPAPLETGQTLILTDWASHHLATVLRAKLGQSLLLFNDTALEYQAVISKIDKKKVQVSIKETKEVMVESPLSVHLGQGLCRGDKMDFVIQKAVELGVTDITPLLTEFGNVKLNAQRMAKKQQHWQQVAISACEQSGRVKVARIHPVAPLSTWLAKVGDSLRLTLAPQGSKKLKDLPDKAESVALLIGPEGGLSEQEIHLSQQHDFLPLSLGPRILRTETAPITMLSLLQGRFGDLA